MKLLWRLIGLTVFLAPLTALAILGASYFANCLMYLSAPGKSMTMPIQTDNGVVTLETGPYSIDVWGGFVSAADASIIDASGKTLVSARSIKVFAPGYINMKESAVRADLEGVRADVTRNELGEFELLKYFKPKPPEEHPIPMQVTLADGQFRFIDKFSIREHILDISVPRLEFATAENAWRAKGLIVGFGGELDADARMSAKQELEVEGRSKDFDIAKIWPYIQDLRELQDDHDAQTTSAEVAILNGPFHVGWSKAKSFTMSGESDLDLKQLRTSYWDRPIDATYRGWATLNSSAGVAEATDGLNKATFIGQMAWKGYSFWMLGKATASSPGLDAIPARYRRDIPKEMTARGINWEGSFRLSDQKVVMSGPARADRLDYGSESFTNIRTKVLGDDREWTAEILGAQWNGSNVTGALQMNQGTGKLSGFVESSSIALGPVARKYFKQNIDGIGSVRALLAGTIQRPLLDIRANGSAAMTFEGEVGRRRGLFELAANLDGKDLAVKRAVLASGDGALVVTGKVDVQSHQMNLQVRGAGIEIADWLRDSGGLATVSVQVTGKWDDPKAGGRIELLNAVYLDQSAPVIVGRLQLNNRKILIDKLSAVRGASRLDGSVVIDWKSKTINGNVEGKGLQLTDFLGPNASGSFSIRNATIRGTLDRPIGSATLDASDMVLQGVRLDTAHALAKMDGNLLTVGAIDLRTGKGSWKGDGWYNLELKTGSIRGDALAIDLEDVLPVVSNDFVVDGIVSGHTEATVTSGVVAAANIRGEIERLKINPTIVGSGTFEASLKAGEWRGSLDIGQPERYIQVPEFLLNLDDKRIEAQLVTFGIPLHEAFLAVRPKLASSALEPRPGKIAVPERLLAILDRLEGSFAANVTVRGDPNDPNVQVESFEFGDLVIAGEKSGTVSLVASRAPRGKWDVQKLDWKGGPGTLTASGTIDEHGDVAVSGDINNLDPTWLAIFEPGFASVNGFANIHFDSEGPVDEPRVTASLDAFLFKETAPSDDRNADPKYILTANVAPITIDKRGILFEGDVEAKGIRGGIEGHLPFEYPFAIPNTEAVDVSLSVPRRRHRPGGAIEQDALDIQSLTKEIKDLRIGGTRHTLQANVHIGGTIDKLLVDGQANAIVDALGVRGVETELRNLDAKLDFSDESVRLTASGTSNFDSAKGQPGKFKAQAKVTAPANFSVFDGDLSDLWMSMVSGHVVLRDFRLKEVDPASGGAGDVVVGADIRISGSVKEPLISTVLPATLQRLTASMPTVFPEAKQQETPEFNPRFAINYVVATKADPAKAKAITANFDVYGAGSITGTLSDLNAAANLTVDRGTIRLPNARVAIEDNGVVRFLFKGRQGGQGDIRLDVDLVGRTSLSSVRIGGTVQRYDIDLRIRGNLLDESTQFITARSDPPDLDQAQILNMLGQRDLFEGLASQFVGDRNPNSLARILAGAALPTLLDPFTERLALELGLEFIQLDYNAFEGASITAAKSLGNGFMFQGRRQVTETIDGRIHFDYRLTWRPPSRFDKFRNLIFSIGADQDRPWKISVEYGIRF